MSFQVDALDSDVYCLQLYDYREQVGWNANAWPQSQPHAVKDDWPDVIEPLSDIYPALVLQGPLG
jgi:hypothetical protein